MAYLIYHSSISQAVEAIAKVDGVNKVLVAQHDLYKGFLPGIKFIFTLILLIFFSILFFLPTTHVKFLCWVC